MKKLSVLLFSLMLMLSLPMVASADVDPSPSDPATVTKTTTSTTSPKTSDDSMAELAMVILLASGATVCVSYRRMRRA